MNQVAARVLLVEDDPRMPEVLAGLLEDDGVELLHAANGDDALALVRDRPVDLVLLDLGLPGLNGFEVLRELKNSPQSQSIPVILLTAWNDTADKLRGFEFGASDYLTKPFEPAELRARLNAALRAKRLQDELAQLNRDLTVAHKTAEMAAQGKADFLSAMSHEIRTPMNGVIAMAELLLETSLTTEQRGYAEMIHSSGEAMLTICNDILDFSKIEAGKLELESEPFDLCKCVESALDMLAAQAAEKQLELAYLIDDGIPPQVVGDVTRLRQVLVNLLSNGIKFTEHGEIVVRVKILSAPQPEVTPPLWHLHFAVRDTGIGIPPERLARLFKSFSQVDASTARQYGGTGLGLAISKRLVDLMNGKMWVESVPGEGSTFHFSLPFKAAAQTEHRPHEAPQPQLANLRLLIVDDNATNCRILTLQTGKWGMTARSAASGRQALEWLRSGEQFDLAVLDMQMPGMDGLMLANEIRKLPNARTLPLILLTSMGVRANNPDFAKVAFASCLTKPTKPAQLYEVFMRVVAGSKPAEQKAPTPSKLDPNLASRLPMRVLICDDNVINQKVALRLVQQMGYRADLTANGIETLAALDRQPYDIIFLDVMMPEMDGLEATRVIRERQRDIKKFPNYKTPIIIVAMTASVMPEDRDKCLQAGMDDYIAKPVRPEDVRAVIERWGPKFSTTQPPASASTAPPPAPASSTPPPAATAVPSDEPSVDMERLMDFTDGNPESLRELVTLYLEQTSEQIGQLKVAVGKGDAAAVRQLAHSCAGASATCGMKRLVPLLRTLERQGDEKNLTGASEICENAAQEFERIREFLAPHVSTPSNVAASASA